MTRLSHCLSPPTPKLAPISNLISNLHSAQSLLWERMVLQSKAFWKYATPLFHARFPFCKEATAEDFYATYNRVSPGCIRVEADEVLYSPPTLSLQPSPSNPLPSTLLYSPPRLYPHLLLFPPSQVTYPLHVILRYDIERALFRGEMEVLDGDRTRD